MADILGFKDIEFGMAAAENERSSKPYLLIEGFFDDYGYIDKITNRDKFLVLGPKGSGKSAIGSKIELLADKKMLFAKTYFLADFPFNKFSELIPGHEAPETRYPSNWEFLLLVALINSYRNDVTCKCEGGGDFPAFVKILQELGVLPDKSLKEIVTITTKKEFRGGIPKLFEASQSAEESHQRYDMNYLFTTLQDFSYSIKCNSQHIIIIDGLDDVLTKRDKQYVSLSSLILAIDRANRKLIENNINSKFVVLCRTDLFEKAAGPNKNKIKRDSAIVLDWYQDVTDVKSTNLIKMINLRATNSLKKDVDIFQEFFPSMMQQDIPMERALVEYTRHTPRDIIQLFNEIQLHQKDKKSKEKVLRVETIKNGMRTYSYEYLVPEIKDELVGYLSNDEIEQILVLFSSMKKSRFSYSEVDKVKTSNSVFNSLDLQKILPILFDCNAIGNVGQGGYHSWKFRNKYASFNSNDEIEIHRGLRKGLNLP